jgi:hypothetical protein
MHNKNIFYASLDKTELMIILYKLLSENDMHRPTISAGLTIWQKRHMPRAPRYLGAPRLLSSIFSEFFCSLFQRGAPKNPSPPENVRPQNLKSEAPKSGAQNVFFPCFSVSAFSVFQRIQCFSAGPQSPRNMSGPKI